LFFVFALRSDLTVRMAYLFLLIKLVSIT